MIKILLIAEPGSGGVKRNILDIIENVEHDTFKLYLVYSKNRADSDYIESLESFCKSYSLNIFEISELQRNISFKKDCISLLKIYNIIKEIKPDVVHCHSSKAGVLGRIAAKFFGKCKIIYTPHSYIFQNPNLSLIKKKFFILLEKILTKYCTNMVINVANDEFELAQECKLGDKNKFVVIHNGIKVDNNYKRNIKNEKSVICITRFDEQKNPYEIIKIAEKIYQKRKDIIFYLVGNGIYYVPIKQYVTEEKIDNIVLTGYSNDVKKFLLKGRVFLSTSLYESFPYAILEALSYGIPVVCTNVIGNREIVKNQQTGWLYNIGDIEKASEIICNIIDEKISIDSQSLIEFIQLNYNIKQMIEKLQKIYIEN